MKKGFTLVELLAVIAILAILVIIALPNVMGMFNTAKENSFKTEVKEIFKTAEQTWIQDSMFNTNERVYSRKKNEQCSKSLDLSGRSELEYYIKLNKSGEVIEYYATDGTFQFSYNNSSTPLKIEKIDGIKQIAKLNESDIISISCGSASGGSNKTYVYTTWGEVGKTLEQMQSEGLVVHNTYDGAIAELGKNYFLRLEITNNVMTGADVGFIINGHDYYLKGYNSSYYEENKTLLNGLSDYTCTEENNETVCTSNTINFDLAANNEGYVSANDNSLSLGGWFCVTNTGFNNAYCAND